MKGRWRRRLGLILLGGVFVGGGWWAGRSTVASNAPTETRSSFSVLEVTEQSVGRTLPLAATASMPVRTVAQNLLPGVVTAVHPGTRTSGDAIYEVAGTPVRLAAGKVPFYRDLGPGAKGADVLELQRLLEAEGHIISVDGDFGAATSAAVRAWQKASGVGQTGRVRLGELVAVPRLPAAVRLAADIVPGALLSGGEPAVQVPPEHPVFTLEVTPQQAALIPDDAIVVIHQGGHDWKATLGARADDASGTVIYQLTAPTGGDICGEDCGALPAQSSTTLRADVNVIPAHTGPAVPAAAVLSRADGSTYVLLASGGQQPVTVLGSSGGLVVLDGIKVGEKVRVATVPAASRGN